MLPIIVGLAACHPSSQTDLSLSRVFNGADAETCQWPSTVAVLWDDTACSGTLVHPQVVVSSSHCGRTGVSSYVDPLAVRFGEIRDAPEREVAISSCDWAPEAFTPGTRYEQVNDLVACTLAEPVDDVPIVPLLDDSDWETSLLRSPATIVGFGATAQPVGDPPSGERRKRFGSMLVTGFDWWLNAILLEEPAGLTASCAGDSGGSVLVRNDDDAWRLAGALSFHWSASGNTDNTCASGQVGAQNLVSRIGWLQDVTGFELVDQGPATNPDVPTGDWASGCGGAR